MNTASLTYLSPKGRRLQRDLMGRSFAEILTHAQQLAARPGVRNVKLWSQAGKLLASPRPTREG